MSQEWQWRTHYLFMREDYDSWQGTHPLDRGVFLRRLKDAPSDFTSHSFGALSNDEAQTVLIDFLVETNRIKTNHFRFTSIGLVSASSDEIVATFDRLVHLARSAVSAFGYSSPNAYLDQRADKWDAIIELDGPIQQ